MPFLTVETNFDLIAQGLNDVAAALPVLIESTTARIHEHIRGILLDALYQAVNAAGSGFPALYADHLAEGIQNLHTSVIVTGDSLIIEIGDPKDLGSLSDLAQGYHYHAILDVPKSEFSVSNPQRVELPYGGQALYNEDKEVRLQFWESLVEGLPAEVRLKGHTITVDTGGLYDETIAARVGFWRSIGSFPEWLILEYGAEDTPAIQPTHFTELLQIRVREYADEVMIELSQDIADVVNRMDVGVGASGRPFNVKTGRFVKYLKE